MQITRKEFLGLAGRGAMASAVYSSFDFMERAQAKQAADILASAEVKKVHNYIAAHKEEHIDLVQRDLRQPSVSSWNKGVKEMAQLMIDSFKKLGCKETILVPTSKPDWPGILASYDVGAPKTIVVYMMYDTQPFVEERWSSPPLEARRVKNFRGFPEAIVARGAVNSKGGNRYTLNALESIIAVHGKLPVNVIFTCDGAEEQGSPNFHEVLDPWRSRLQKANCLMSLGPSQQADGMVSMSLGNKGIMYVELEANGAQWGRGPQKMPIHSSRKAVLDSPVWRLVEALRSMYDPSKNEILIARFKDDIRPPKEEELELMRVLTTKFRDRLFGSDRENLKAFMHNWTPEEAAHHLTFDTTLNIDGVWGGYTGPGVATILPEKAAVKIDARLVPNQDVRKQADLVREHLDKHGFSDIELRRLGGGDEWSQTSVKEPVVQSTLAMYKQHGIEPMVWPRSAGSSPEWEYTRKLGLAAGGGALGHGSRAHSDDEYIVTEGNGKVAGIVGSEQSIVDLLYAYAHWPEKR
ncbi:MAG TPA: M20/M25/M40 family metallo-hydrolase [Acidobacteriota bacterium]|jgi:acetylornithine deacetylase/succinyl-diaminopimelate desuccinylase-like protein|nr:M20/M25/M40 family metallo-hydrolase [Acidobacteriota bacterium]